jgi:DNA-binding NarL/FixJ family response regulator
MIQIIIVDDHRLFRFGLQSAFRSDYPDICVVGEAETGEDLFGILASTPADLVLLDINLPGGIGGVETARRLRSEYPDVKILAISAENTAETIHAMLEAGIDGFISKQKGDHDELATAIRSIMEGMEYFGRDISAIIFGVYVSKKKTTDITPEFSGREREVIEMCRDGLMCKEIADRMGVTANTINTYKKRIFQKLGINTMPEAVQYALKRGIIRIEN